MSSGGTAHAQRAYIISGFSTLLHYCSRRRAINIYLDHGRSKQCLAGAGAKEKARRPQKDSHHYHPNLLIHILMMSQMLILSDQGPQLLLMTAPVNHRLTQVCQLLPPPPPFPWLMTRGRRRRGPRRPPATSALVTAPVNHRLPQVCQLLPPPPPFPWLMTRGRRRGPRRTLAT